MKLPIKQIVLNLFLVLSFQCISAQQSKADSLYNVWTNKNIDEAERIKAFYSRFTIPEVPFNEIIKWAYSANEALVIAEKLNKVEYLGFFNMFLGGPLVNSGNSELGCEYFKKGLKIAEEQRDIYMILGAMPFILESNCPELTNHKLLEILNRIESKVEQHFAFFDVTKAMLIKEKSKDKTTYCQLLKSALDKSIDSEQYFVAKMAIAQIITSKCSNYSLQDIEVLLVPLENKLQSKKEGTLFLRDTYWRIVGESWVNNNFPIALKAAQKAKYYSEQLNLVDEGYYRSIQRIGYIHNEIGNYNESEKYLVPALKTAKAINDFNFIGSAYIDLAKLYLNKKEENLAKRYLDSAIYIMRDVKECENCYALARITKAGINNLKQKHTEALNELVDVKTNIIGNKNFTDDVGKFYLELSKAYFGLRQYPKAIANAKTGLRVKDIRLSTISELNNVLYKAKEEMGDYKSSLQYYKSYVLQQDSLTILRNSEEVTRLELENQFAQERFSDSLEVAQQKLETEFTFQKQLNKQKTTRNLFLALGLMAIILAIGLWYRLQYIRKTNKIIEAEKQKAQASEKAKHQFLANMSHEIRTPMNAIKGMTDILIRRQPKANQKEYLDGIKQSSDSLLVIINDILDISKIEAGKIELENESFSINKLVHNVHTIMQFKAEEKGLELKKDIPSDPIYVKGDAIRLRQILINLIGNAIKFTEKGIVTTTVKSEQEENQLRLHFTVSDTGMGIDKDRLDKIFKSFEQAYSDTSRKFGGTGLGLSISKKLVELHNGKLWVDSEKGKGSQFHFTISYEVAENDTKEVSVDSSKSNMAEALKGTKILLVEDNQFNAVVAQEELEDAIESVDVAVAENGAIAVEKLKSGDYDVILMDVQMPKMNGYEATKTIRAMKNGKAHIPIIAMTANVLKEEVDKCYDAGMDDFIGKPFDTNELLKKIYNLKVKTHE